MEWEGTDSTQSLSGSCCSAPALSWRRRGSRVMMLIENFKLFFNTPTLVSQSPVNSCELLRDVISRRFCGLVTLFAHIADSETSRPQPTDPRCNPAPPRDVVLS